MASSSFGSDRSKAAAKEADSIHCAALMAKSIQKHFTQLYVPFPNNSDILFLVLPQLKSFEAPEAD